MAGTAGALTLPGVMTGATATVTTIGTTTGLTGDAFAAGASGVITVSGASGLAHDGGNVTITSNAPGVTFSGAVEGSATAFTVNFTSSATTTTAGTYSLSLTDNNGAATGSITNAFTVDALPTLTGFSTTTASQGQTIGALVITGTGFNNSGNTDTNTNVVAQVTISNATNGTPIVPGTASYINFAANAASTSLTLNSITLLSTTAVGAYNVTLTNEDGGSVTYTNAITVGAQGLTNVSPSSIVGATPGTPASTKSVTLTGSGFQNGAVVTIGTTSSYAGGASATVVAGLVTPGVGFTAPTINYMAIDSAGILPAGTFVKTVNGTTSFLLWNGTAAITVSTALQAALIAGDVLTFEPVAFYTTAFVSPSEIDGTLTTAIAALNAGLTVTVTNPSTGGGNGVVASLTAGLGFGRAATAKPTIVSVTAPTAALVAGAATASTVVINGYGFDPNYTEVATFLYAGSTATSAVYPTADSNFTTSCTSSANGQTLTCSVTANSGVFAGLHGVAVTNVGVSTYTGAAGDTVVAGKVTPAAFPSTAPIVGELVSDAAGILPAGTFVHALVAGTSFTLWNAGAAITVSTALHTALIAGDVLVFKLATTSSPYISAPALNVDGPSFSSITPSTVPAGSAIGTTIAIAGSGLNNTLQVQADPNGNGGTATGIISTVSPTSATYALSAKPAAGYNWITAAQYSANGALVWAQPISFVVTGLPTVTSTVDANNFYYGAGGLGIGAGAQGGIVLISGTGFKAGAKVASFTNVNGTADAGVTATFVKVNVAGTLLTVAVTVAATDTNISDGFTVTNTDGGSVKVAAFGIGALVIDNGPTISAVTPATAAGGSTTSFTITGTNFSTNAAYPSVVSTTGNGTCGTATVVSLTSITVSCTFGVAGATASSLVVTNPDDGSATSAAVLAAAKPAVAPTKIPAFNVAFAKGSAALSAAAKAALTTFASSVTDGSSVTVTAWGTTGALATARVAAIANFVNAAGAAVHFTLAHGVNKTLNKGVVTETTAK